MAHVFSSMEVRTPAEEAELQRELLTLLGGVGEVDEAWVSEALGGSFVLDRGSLARQHAVHGCMGVLDTGQSLSAELLTMDATDTTGPYGTSARQVGLYLKKIKASRFAHKKTPADLRRDLASCHNECAFYQHVAPLLQAEAESSRVVRIPRCYYVREQSFHAAAEAQLSESEYMFVLETMASVGGAASASSGSRRLVQHSPLGRSEARQSLDLIARFHAWAWNDRAKLELVRTKLLPRAS